MRVCAIDQQRPGNPDGNLRNADEMLDAAWQHRRIEGELTCVLQLHAGLLFEKLQAGLNHLVAVIVCVSAEFLSDIEAPFDIGILAFSRLPRCAFEHLTVSESNEITYSARPSKISAKGSRATARNQFFNRGLAVA